MFEKATRIKLRINYRGNITVEDLWDLPVEELDLIYTSLRAEQKALSEDSLLKKETEDSKLNDLCIGIVKHIVKTKLSEEEQRENRAAAMLKKERIAAIIEEKQDEGLKEMSLEELKREMELLG